MNGAFSHNTVSEDLVRTTIASVESSRIGSQKPVVT
jgi:hypothetical protein